MLLYKGELKKKPGTCGGKYKYWVWWQSLKIFPKEMLMAFSNSAQHNHQYTVHTLHHLSVKGKIFK